MVDYPPLPEINARVVYILCICRLEELLMVGLRTADGLSQAVSLTGIIPFMLLADVHYTIIL